MPSLQVVDFGSNPLADSLGKMAQGFSQTIFDRMEDKRNKDLLDEVDKLDLPMDQKILQISKAYGIDPAYKQDRISAMLKVAELENKRDRTAIDKLTAERLKSQSDLNIRKYEETVKGQSPQAIKDAAIRAENQRRLELQENRLQQSIQDKAKAYPEKLAKYINSQLKDSGETMSSNDRAMMTDIIDNLVRDQKIPLGDAYQSAYDAVRQKNELVQNVMAVRKPAGIAAGWTSAAQPPSAEEVSKGREQLFNQLVQLFDQGVRSQTDLRKIAKSGGWDTDEVNSVLQQLFQAKRMKYQPTKVEKTEKQAENMSAEERKALLRSVLQ